MGLVVTTNHIIARLIIYVGDMHSDIPFLQHYKARTLVIMSILQRSHCEWWRNS